ncbi:MAG: S26 family signal peptidase, partial [Endomicrobiia bacterium]
MEAKLFSIGIAAFLLSLVYRFGIKSNNIFNRKFFVFVSGAFWSSAGSLLSLFLSLFFHQEFNQKTWIISGYIFGFFFGIIAGLLSGKNEEKKKKIIFWQKEWIDTIWSSVLLASVIMYFIIQAFKIPSGSMRMTFIEGDHLFVNKF